MYCYTSCDWVASGSNLSPRRRPREVGRGPVHACRSNVGQNAGNRHSEPSTANHPQQTIHTRVTKVAQRTRFTCDAFSVEYCEYSYGEQFIRIANCPMRNCWQMLSIRTTRAYGKDRCDTAPQRVCASSHMAMATANTRDTRPMYVTQTTTSNEAVQSKSHHSVVVRTSWSFAMALWSRPVKKSNRT